VVTPKTPKNHQLCATAATKKKGVEYYGGQNACTQNQRSDSHWRHQSARHKWSRKHKFDTCWSRSRRYWGGLLS